MKTIEQFSSVPENGIIIRQEGAILRVFFGIKAVEQSAGVTDEDSEGASPSVVADLYECNVVDVKGRTYSEIVAAIVNGKYSSDDVQALQSNYIEAKDTDSGQTKVKRAEYLTEWSEFQDWRKEAKEVAAEVVEMLK